VTCCRGSAYLRGNTPQEGSGFSGDELAWRQARWHITEAITGNGTFLDVGCANGLLMESVTAWCADRGVIIEPYGIDLAAGLVGVARARLPKWADRIWLGSAIDWMAPDGYGADPAAASPTADSTRKFAVIVAIAAIPTNFRDTARN